MPMGVFRLRRNFNQNTHSEGQILLSLVCGEDRYPYPRPKHLMGLISYGPEEALGLASHNSICIVPINA